MRPSPLGYPHQPILEVSDLRCPSCKRPPVLLRTTDRDTGNPDNAARWKAAIGCQGCGVLTSNVGAVEQGAIDGAIGYWHWVYREPLT
tara:strand:- start:337 stop:600 length:264 start_codon:yes stop_codon:yes gene_type:complete